MAKSSPTPWKAVRHNPGIVTIEDANGMTLATAHQFPPYCDSMKTAQLIVEAVNEHIARHRMIDVETLDHVASERDRLRDIVRRLEDEYEQLEERDTVCNTDRTRRIEALFREAREALGEQEP